MKRGIAYRDFAMYYDALYIRGAKKDYKKEVDFINKEIKDKREGGKRIIEVACGTGNHTKYLLRKGYNVVTAVDISPEMLKIYKSKYPHIKTVKADMKSMKLKTPADIILCLFSSINYNQSKKHLERTFKNFYNHLEKGGIVVVDARTSNFEKEKIDVISAKLKDKEVIRLGKLIRRGKFLDFFFVYSIIKDGKIYSETEKHTIRIFSKTEVINSLKKAGFKVVTKNLGKRPFFFGFKK